jgi:hypothetical protein
MRMARTGHLFSRPEHGPIGGSRFFLRPLEWSVRVAIGNERRRKGDDRDRRRCADGIEGGTGIRRRRRRERRANDGSRTALLDAIKRRNGGKQSEHYSNDSMSRDRRDNRPTDCVGRTCFGYDGLCPTVAGRTVRKRRICRPVRSFAPSRKGPEGRVRPGNSGPPGRLHAGRAP